MGSVCSWTESTVLNTKFEPNTSVLSTDMAKLLDHVIMIHFRICALFSKKIACSVPQTSLKKKHAHSTQSRLQDPKTFQCLIIKLQRKYVHLCRTFMVSQIVSTVDFCIIFVVHLF